MTTRKDKGANWPRGMTSNACRKRGHSRKGRCLVKLTEPEEIAPGIHAFEKGTTPADYARPKLGENKASMIRSHLAQGLSVGRVAKLVGCGPRRSSAAAPR